MPADELLIVADAAAVAQEAARRFARAAAESVASRGRFTVALAGGATPKAMQRLLAAPPLRDLVDWSATHVFWSDERLVPASDPESTFGAARSTLLDRVPVPPANVHAAPAHCPTPDDAARRYAQALADHFGALPPRFDLILLGLGTDGHTASIFPGSPLIPGDDGAWVRAVTDAPKPPPVRITFTFTLINQARQVLFCAEGGSKADAVAGVFDPAVTAARIPAKAVRPIDGSLAWLLDRDAARRLESTRRR